MQRNKAGQAVGAQMIDKATGDPFTGQVTVYITLANGTQAIGSVGSGIAAHKGKGYHVYAPSQAETDSNHLGYTFEGTGAITVTVQAIPSSEVWDVDYSLHKIAGTFGKLMDTLRKSNTVIEGTILASPTPTTTTFRISGADYPTGALEHAVLWMSTGTSAEQNSPILTTVNNGDGTLTITLEEALTVAPVAGDVVLIDPTSHVHAIVDIVSGVWSALTSGFNVNGSAGEVVKALASMLEFVSGAWRWVANSLSQAPTGGGGDGIYARTFVVSSPSGAVSGVSVSVVGTSIRVVTDTSGTTAVNLDAGTYTIRFGVPPGFAQQADLTLAVSASGSTSVSLTPVSVPAPPSANSCLLSVYVRNQSTEPAGNITVQARLPKGWDVQVNTFAVNEIVTDVTDSAGLAQLYLMRSTKYELSFSRTNGTIAKIPIETPDAATANLSQVYTG
jgi:uncharacterized repeat protein (TIGR01451 family)